MQAPAAVRAALAPWRGEAGPAVEHLDAQHAVAERDPQLDLAVLAHVLDRVGNQLGDEQTGVLEHLDAEVVAQAIDK